ncbi:FtsX-like permease family protein [Bdellovibrio sp. SKB1291214]|uniref:ABC transporter permease n=1 Tax=Bdellovibrio sp. SKB1291214 TaxID=1732569 RepID=UPI000B51CAE6|nr:ABC transporter permease [Bdellovibrio sp. SKB1291214]UYL08397.1 FtsX-like permease family protein [Bdellovibrio sp. SKB1291214]
MSLLHLSYIYLKRHLFTTVSTIFSLSIAIAAVTVLLKLEVLSHSRFDTLADQGNAIVGAKSGGIDILLGALNFEGDVPNYIPQNLYETLRARKDISFEDQSQFKDSFKVNHITPLLFFGMHPGGILVGTDESLLTLYPEATAPRLQSGTFPQNPGEVLVGADYAQKGNVQLGQSIFTHAEIYGSKIASSPFSLKVVGILKPTGKSWDKGLYTNLQTAQSAVAATPGYNSIWGPKVLSYFLMDIQDGGQESLASLINQRTVAQIAFTAKEKTKLANITGSNQTLQLLVVGILLLVSTLTVLAVFFTRIEGRTVELAILRALGRSRQELTGLLILEGLIMGVISVALAAVLELILNPVILSTAGSTLPEINASNWPWWMILLTGGLSLMAVMFASLPPVWKLYRQDVHTTLRNIH